MWEVLDIYSLMGPPHCSVLRFHSFGSNLESGERNKIHEGFREDMKKLELNLNTQALGRW